MPRKRNEQQELQNEQEEFDINEGSSLNTASDETTAPSNENEVLLVNQTYLTEETLPGEYLGNTQEQVAEERDEDLNEEESEYETEEENSEEYEYEEESETEYEEEEGELDEEGEYEESEDAEAGEPVRSKIGLVIDRVMASVKDADGNIDKAQIAKYAGVAVLAIYGLSRKSMLGKILISGVVSLLAKQLLNGNAAKQEGETDENEAVAA